MSASAYERSRAAEVWLDADTVREFTCSICGSVWQQGVKAGRPPTVCSRICFDERARRRATEWVKNNPGRRADYQKRTKEHRDRVGRERYLRNKQRENERSVRYKREHPEYASREGARRYALTKGSPYAESFSLDEIYIRDRKVCYLCGKGVDRGDATMDHVIPVTRQGPHTRANVRLAHRACNTRKGNKLLAA